MAQIKWTRRAIRDLHSIHQFISNDSSFYADRFIERLIERTDQLLILPESGRIIPEWGEKTLRELIEGNYRIFYKITTTRIFILRIHHAARIVR